MADPVDMVPGPNGQPIPHFMQATPGISGAIQDLLRVLLPALAPKSVTQARPRTDQAVSQQVGPGGESMSPQSNDLGNQF